MDYEYAVEPQAVATSWDRFQNIISRFGFEKGKLISDFPQRDWSRQVRLATDENGLGELERKQISEGLNKAKREGKVRRFGRNFDRKQEDNNLPFHDRYLLGNKGGISLGAGFEPKIEETTTLGRHDLDDVEVIRQCFAFDGTGHKWIEPGFRVFSNRRPELIRRGDIQK